MASGQEELSVTIPPDIITEILYYLPAKSIGRFRCVSKDWLSQLTHPDFIKIHLNNNTSSHQNHLIFQTHGIVGGSYLHSHPFHSRETVVTEPTKFDLQLKSNPYRVLVCGSCDGLVLVHAVCKPSVTMVVINPTTRKCVQLPEEDYNNLNDTSNNEYEHIGNLCGFGYDSMTDDYKVVCLTYYCDRYLGYRMEDRADKVYVHVYSLRNRKWRRVTDSPYGYLIKSSWGSYGVFFNGFIHWIVRTDDDDLLGIVAFSLADECFSEISFPKLSNVNDKLTRVNCQLLVLGGKLGIFIRSEGVVWLMNKYGVTKSWTNIILHGIDKVPIFKPGCYIKPLVFYDNGKILVAYGERMMVYEFEKAAFTETVCAWNTWLFLVGFYVESLVSPKLGKEEEDDDYDSLKAKHQEEKLRADRLDEALSHALSKQQALERRTMEQDDEIESLKARLVVADEKRRKAVAALLETVKNTLN